MEDVLACAYCDLQVQIFLKMIVSIQEGVPDQ